MHTPDKWLLLKCTPSDGAPPFYRIWATWGGSYTYGANWRLNSGINEVRSMFDGWICTGVSGTAYHLRRGAAGYVGAFPPPLVEGVELVGEASEFLDDWAKGLVM